MNITVTGKFSALKQASRAVDKLLESCVSDDRVRTIVLKPTAQRPAQIATGACEKSSRSRSNRGAAAQIAPTRGGMLDGIGDDERRSSNRPAGVLVAVETPDHVSRALAVNVLRKHGARIVDSDAGSSSGKNRPDSDPVSLPALLDRFEADKKRGIGIVPIEIERPSSADTGRRAGSGDPEDNGRQRVACSSGQKDFFVRF